MRQPFDFRMDVSFAYNPLWRIDMAATATNTEDTSTGRRRLTGKVVSIKMQKSATVRVERLVKHARYHKYIRRCKNYTVHDENDSAQLGDVVVIEECRPLSKRKHFVIVQTKT